MCLAQSDLPKWEVFLWEKGGENMRERNVVGLDVDSTAVDKEGLNWLADRKGVGNQVKKLTEDSMNGRIPVEQVMPLKMDIISPSRSDIAALSQEYLAHVSPDLVQVVQELKRAGKHVVIITGNFHEAIDPLAESLGLDPEHDVFANNLLFDANGDYAGFVENYHLMHDDGKQQVVKELRQQYRHITHVGDSMGDMLAGADIFIGYGGAAIRSQVLIQSELYIPGPSLAPVLSVELSRRQLRHIPDQSLRERAQSGLLVRRGVH